MKKNVKKKRISLSKETIALLSKEQAGQVQVERYTTSIQMSVCRICCTL